LLLARQGPTILATGAQHCRLGHVIPRSTGDRPDGVFAGWSWDGQTLRAENDRYGMHPLYYFSTPDRFAISSSVPALLLLGAPTELDAAALAVFLRLGFFLGEDTPFRSIRALPPAAWLEWREGRLTISGGLELVQAQSLSRRAAVDGFIELFRTAMARRARPGDEVGVPLSGGRDSRHILLELCRSGNPPGICVTVDPHPPFISEVPAASGVARAAGVRHIPLNQPGSRLDSEIRKNRLTNYCADEHAWYLPVADYLHGRVRYIYDGIGGDVLSAGLFLTPALHAAFTEGRLEDLAASLLNRREGVVCRLLSRQWAAPLGRDPAVARLATELARHTDAANPVGSFYFWNRTRREVTLIPYRILNRSAEVLSPYLDHELFDLLASLPAESLMDRGLHSEAIDRAFPQYRDLPFHERARKPFRGEFFRFAWGVARYARQTSRAAPSIRLVDPRALDGSRLMNILAVSPARLDWYRVALALYLSQLSSEVERPPLE
jgi:hypothetical protein